MNNSTYVREEADTEEIPAEKFENPTARKVMTGVEFVLQLCRLIKAILYRIFLWLEDWEARMEHRTPAEPEPQIPEE
jgi:hypothetical protein